MEGRPNILISGDLPRLGNLYKELSSDLLKGSVVIPKRVAAITRDKDSLQFTSVEARRRQEAMSPLAVIGAIHKFRHYRGGSEEIACFNVGLMAGLEGQALNEVYKLSAIADMTALPVLSRMVLTNHVRMEEALVLASPPSSARRQITKIGGVLLSDYTERDFGPQYVRKGRAR